MNKEKKKYVAPHLAVMNYKADQGYATSIHFVSGSCGLGNSWSDESGDAWDEFLSGSNDSYLGEGWTNNGNSAWN